MTVEANLPARDPRTTRWQRRVLLVMALLILVPSMLGFGTKFIELVAIFRGDAEGAFTVAPLVNYLLASAGFLLLLVWAAWNGMFSDIERPKYDLLENERQLDQQH